MKLVKISDLNEEERKKAFEEQQKRLEENRRISEQNRINANNQFNELINRTGAFDTNNHTTNFYNITNAMKSSGASKQSINAFKKNNHVSLWDSVLDIMNGTGKTVENTWLGLNNGIKSMQQSLIRGATDIQKSRMDFANKENKRMLEQRAKTHPEEENQIKQTINNPLVTGEQLREEEKKLTEKMQSKKEENLQKINKNAEEIDNPILKKIASDTAPAIGNAIPAFLSGGLGAIYMAGSATGQYYDDAKQRGMSDEEAKTYSGIMGLMEGATEMIGINNLSKAGKGLKELVKGTGKEVAKETAEKVSKSTVKEVLKDYGIGIADNMIQEALIDPIQEFTAQTVAGKDKAQWNGLGNRMLQDAINGGLVGAILGGANLGIQSCTGLVQKYNSNQEITLEEFKTAVKDASKELDTGEMIKQNIQQEVNKYNLQNENVQNNIVNTKEITFEESASANNIDINNETIKTVNQALSNRDIAGRFDSSYFKNSNENAIWRTYKDEEGKIKREVIFNPNGDSQNTMQQISIHELTHDLVGTKEYEELKNLVLDKNKTREGYEEARQSLESTYSQVYDSNSENFKSLVDDEEVADTLAQKLGDQDFINSLNVEKPNVFKRIYNWVVDKVNKITGNKIEKLYWEDIKNKFENAYSQEYKGTESQEKFSFVGQKGIKNAVQQEPVKYISVERKLNKAKQMQQTGIDNESIRRNTGWFQDKNGDWKFEISDKNMKIKNNVKLKENTSYKLGDILEHDALYKIYPELKNYKVSFEDINTSGSIKLKENKIKISNKNIKKKANIEGTLIHEIQHAIQNIENFEGGRNSKRSKLAYYNSLGEIEASDTKTRFLNEKYRNKNIHNTPPESSKAQPQHKDLNNYLKNRNLLDKIKDSMYNNSNINNGEKNYEYDIKQNYKPNKSENDYEKMEEVKKKSTRKEYDIETGNSNITDNLDIRHSTNTKGAWQEFLNTQIGERGKGKTVQELRLPTKENAEIIENRKKINQHNKEKLEKVGITKDNDIITNKENFNEKVEEEKIANILEEMPTKEKEKSRAWAIFKANVFDKGIVFEELSRKTKNRELQGKWDYTLTANARGQNAIGVPRYEFDSKTKTQKLVSKSLESIREEVGENKTEFNNYMYHQLNIDRMTLEERFGGDTGINYERKNPIKNKPVFSNEVTAEMSQEIVNKYEQSNPEFKEWAKDVYDFLDANTQELVKSGVISEDTRQVFKEMYPHYVPIARVNNKGNAIAVPLDTGRTGVNSPIKRAKGGNQDILPLFETMADRTLQTYRASARNSFGVELLHTLQTPQTAENVDVDNVMEEITNSENEELLKKGNKTAPPTFTVFENGEKVTFEISKDMYDALKPVGEGLSYKSKVLNKISNFRRGVLTEYNPVFMITNSLKDIQDVVINSQHIAKTISKLPEAYNQILKKGYWYNEYIQNGGEQNSYFNANDGSFENDKKSKLAKNVATFPLRAISKVNNIIEMSPRLAEYIASREKGISIETSMLDASRVTTNFKAGGNVTKFLNRNGATFLNASVQGAMQQIRNIQEAKVKGLKGWTVLACKYAVAGLPVILLNNILWGDDEDYEELQDYVKDNYYCVAKYGNGKFIRIPKGRTTATIQKIVSNVNEYLTEDKEINIDNLAKDFWEDLQFAMDNLAPNNPIDNNIVSPIIQAVTNTSWYGEDIVPGRLQDKPKEEQYDETTDKFSKWLGEKLKISPYKINYLLDQYGGGISDVVLPALTPQAENNMMEDKFTTDSVMKSKYPGDFFEKSDEINVKANSDKATDLDKVKSKYLTQTSEEMNKLYKEKRKIQNSDVEDSIKKDKLKEVQKEINKLARKGMEEVEKVEIKGITAKVGNESYYKYHGEWTTLSDEEKEKGLDKVIKSYADYKNKVYETTKQKQDIGELKEDEQLKEKDKLKILEDSKHSDADKQKIYKETIGNDDDLYKQVLQTSNININEYLKYKQQEFESDKEDDGTLSGKTIKNSKKQKVYDYVKKMKINDTQRLLILGKQFKLNRNEQQMLYSYINDIPRLTKEERLEIFKMYSNNFEIYKSGKLSFK